MKCLVFSDIHSNFRVLDRLVEMEADYYFAAGDLVSWARGLDRCGEVLKRRGDRVYVLPGNHESAEQVTEFCRKFGFHDFHEQTIRVAGYHIAGLGYSSPTPFHTPGEFTEEEIALRLRKFAGLQPLVLVCHCPPYGTPLDQVRDGVHAGSRAIREFIEEHQPEFFFCGHIHEAEGVSATIGKTRAFNAGQRGYLLDFDRLEL